MGTAHHDIAHAPSRAQQPSPAPSRASPSSTSDPRRVGEEVRGHRKRGTHRQRAARGAARGAAPLALAGSADELGAVLRLTFVPQLRAVRNLLGEILLGHLRGCGVLCRADAEAAAWLAPLGSAPRAEALGSP